MSEKSHARRVQRGAGCVTYQTALIAWRKWVKNYRTVDGPFGEYLRRGEEVVIKRLKEKYNGVA